MYKIVSPDPAFLRSIPVRARARAPVQQGPSASGLPNKPEIQQQFLAESRGQNSARIDRFKVADKKFRIVVGFGPGAPPATGRLPRARPDGGKWNSP